MKKFIVAAASLLLCLGMFGCASGGASPESFNLTETVTNEDVSWKVNPEWNASSSEKYGKTEAYIYEGDNVLINIHFVRTGGLNTVETKLKADAENLESLGNKTIDGITFDLYRMTGTTDDGESASTYMALVHNLGAAFYVSVLDNEASSKNLFDAFINTFTFSEETAQGSSEQSSSSQKVLSDQEAVQNYINDIVNAGFMDLSEYSADVVNLMQDSKYADAAKVAEKIKAASLEIRRVRSCPSFMKNVGEKFEDSAEYADDFADAIISACENFEKENNVTANSYVEDASEALEKATKAVDEASREMIAVKEKYDL